jgi:hypothetical protein
MLFKETTYHTRRNCISKLDPGISRPTFSSPAPCLLYRACSLPITSLTILGEGLGTQQKTESIYVVSWFLFFVKILILWFTWACQVYRICTARCFVICEARGVPADPFPSCYSMIPAPSQVPVTRGCAPIGGSVVSIQADHRRPKVPINLSRRLKKGAITIECNPEPRYRQIWCAMSPPPAAGPGLEWSVSNPPNCLIRSAALAARGRSTHAAAAWETPPRSLFRATATQNPAGNSAARTEWRCALVASPCCSKVGVLGSAQQLC